MVIMEDRPVVGPCGHCAQDATFKCSGCKSVVYCGVECQKAHRKEHKGDCRCWEMVDIKGKGQGLLTKRRIKAGEVVIRERPLVIVSTPHTTKTLAKFVAELRQKVRRLEEEQQDDFFSLGVARPELCTKDRGEWMVDLLKLYSDSVLQEKLS